VEPFKPGQTLGPYEVIELLGEGAMARVYKVRHRETEELFAVKVLMHLRGDLVDRLLQEGRVQSRLSHPNIVAVVEIIQVDGLPALVMEYIRGRSLEAVIREKGPLPWKIAGPLFAQICAGVEAAHAAEVLHRDLKPGNILLEPGPHGYVPKIADFGIAKVLAEGEAREGRTRARVKLGTPGYMAPEQWADSASVDARADLFALGVILYELLAGCLPYEGSGASQLLKAIWDGRFVPLIERVPSVPESVSVAVSRAIQAEPPHRFDDVTTFRTAIFSGMPVEPPPPRPVDPDSEEAEGPPRRAGCVLGAIVFGVVVLPLLVMFGIYQAERFMRTSAGGASGASATP
jgi:serine/threonine-protein kinase